MTAVSITLERSIPTYLETRCCKVGGAKMVLYWFHFKTDFPSLRSYLSSPVVSVLRTRPRSSTHSDHLSTSSWWDRHRGQVIRMGTIPSQWGPTDSLRIFRLFGTLSARF